MHPLLAFAGRTLLILALVLTGPGFSARAMAAMHGGHGVVTQDEVVATFVRMAKVVDEQNAHDASYEPMSRDPEASIAFQAAPQSRIAMTMPHSEECALFHPRLTFGVRPSKARRYGFSFVQPPRLCRSSA